MVSETASIREQVWKCDGTVPSVVISAPETGCVAIAAGWVNVRGQRRYTSLYWLAFPTALLKIQIDTQPSVVWAALEANE